MDENLPPSLRGMPASDLPPSLRGLSPDELPPSLRAGGAPPAPAAQPRRVGALESALRTVGDAARTAVGTFDMAAAGLARIFGGQDEAERVLGMREQRQQRMGEVYSPQPGEDFSTVGRLAGGVMSAPIELVGGLGLQHGVERAAQVVERGGTLPQAAQAGSVSGGVHAALNLLPIKAGGAVGRAFESRLGGLVGGAVTGGGLVAGAGTAGRVAENAALPAGEQFTDLQASVAPSAEEVGMGAAFGAIPGVRAAAGDVSKSAVRNVAKAVGEGVGTGAAKAVSAVTPDISPETAATVRKAARFNIDLPPDAFTNNKYGKVAGEVARNVPLAGAKVEENAVAFNRAHAKSIGAGEADKITPKVFDEAMTRSGETIGRITEANPIPLDKLQSTIDSIREASRARSGDVAGAVENYLKEVEAKAEGNDGVVPGKAMKEILGQMGRDAQTATNGPVRNALGELHDALSGDVNKVVGPEDAKVLREARRQYSNGLTLVPLILPSGNISPAGFNQQFRTGRAGKMRAARGRGGDQGDLAEVAQYMREPGTSMTAERGAVLATLAGSGYVEPVSAAVTAAGANVYNRLGPRVLREKAGVKKGEQPPPESPVVPPEAGPTSDVPPHDGSPPGGPPAALTDTGNPALNEVERLRASTESPEVHEVLDEHAKKIAAEAAQKVADEKRKAAAAELRRAADKTIDPEIAAALRKNADKLEKPEPIPAGEAKELPSTPTPKVATPKKIPAGEATELPVETITPENPEIPTGEATEITPDVVEVGNVPDQVTQQGRVQQERGQGNEGGKETEAGAGDRVQREAEGGEKAPTLKDGSKPEVGKTYVDAKGKKAVYQADGTWKELD